MAGTEIAYAGTCYTISSSEIVNAFACFAGCPVLLQHMVLCYSYAM